MLVVLEVVLLVVVLAEAVVKVLLVEMVRLLQE